MKRSLGFWMAVTCCGLALAAPPRNDAPKENQPAKAAKHWHETDAFFAAPMPRLALEIKKPEMDQLRAQARSYVEASLTEGDKAFPHVAVKLKGSSGSFKPVDEKPGLTLNFDKFKGADRFHGQKKMHLNNGNEDPSFLREWLAGEIAHAAGMPAGRCTHTLLSINGKDKGLYVVREGFTKDFLAAHFGDDRGALFEGHFCKDFDTELELDSGDESARIALKELMAACEVESPAARWERLGKILDLEAYASYFAFEQAMDFSDGYDFNLNNYRLYFVRNRFCFVLHGMDEVFKSTDVSLLRDPKSRLGQAFLSCPQGRALYRQKITELYEKVLHARDWPAAVAARADFVKAGLVAAGSRRVKEFAQNAEALKENVARRIENLGKELQEWPEPLAFDAKGVASMTKGWHVENENGDAADLNEDGPALHVAAKNESTASWRCTAVLDAGRYRFEARVRGKAIEALDDEKGRGAGLRISGSQERRGNALVGSAEWTNLGYEFDVNEPREVVLVAELRARKGEAWFARDSFRLVRLK